MITKNPPWLLFSGAVSIPLVTLTVRWRAERFAQDRDAAQLGRLRTRFSEISSDSAAERSEAVHALWSSPDIYAKPGDALLTARVVSVYCVRESKLANPDADALKTAMTLLSEIPPLRREVVLDGGGFRGLFLEDLDMRGISLRDADLNEAQLLRCNLSGVDLTGAQAEGLRLRGPRSARRTR